MLSHEWTLATQFIIGYFIELIVEMVIGEVARGVKSNARGWLSNSN